MIKVWRLYLHVPVGDAADRPGLDGSSVSCERVCIHPHPPKAPKPSAAATSSQINVRSRADSGNRRHNVEEQADEQSNDTSADTADNAISSNREQVNILSLE